jgi:hypothetical protein
MKILIIATPRSGSTTLTNSIAVVLGYDKYHEPFNYSHPYLANRTIPDQYPEDVVIKTLFHQLPLDSDNPFLFYKDEILKYDKVIILARQDLKASYESFNHNLVHNENGPWHLPYMYKETDFNLNLYKDYLKWTSDIIEFSRISNIEMTWYEDLYFGDRKKNIQTINNWNIDISAEQLITTLKNRKKYRINNKETLI